MTTNKIIKLKKDQEVIAWNPDEMVYPIWNPLNPEIMVPVYVHFGSNIIRRKIPLKNFSKDFKEMYAENFFKKVFYDEEQRVTAHSIHNTFFIPKISNDF